MTRPPRHCPECGAEFTPKDYNQVCCTRECQRARTKRLEEDRQIYRNYHAEYKDQLARKAREANLAARDAAYVREYGHPCGRPRGKLLIVSA